MLKSKSSVLYAAIILLTLSYFLSFCGDNKDKREKIQTALINPNHKEKIAFLEFYDGENQKIALVKKEGFWEIQKNYGNSAQKMPANSKKIAQFLNEATKIVNMYKISDVYEENNSFLILKPGSVRLKYGFENSFYEIFFGGNDFSQSFRYLATGKSTRVYEISNYLDDFLTLSTQFWADPLLISCEIFGKIDVRDVQRNYAKIGGVFFTIADLRKLLDLRHGGFFDGEVLAKSENLNISGENENPANLKSDDSSADLKTKSRPELSELFLELGNKNTIKLEFFRESENSQIRVKSYYLAADGFATGGEKSGAETFVFDSKISLWTYNKIKETTL